MVAEPAWGRAPGWALWLALAVCWFATVPWRPLLDPDEGRYAEIPREMAASGDWITPRLDGLKYFEKPPLQYWATAAAYSTFGISEWTARLWSVGLAFLCLPMVYAWTAKLYGMRAGLAALVALAVSPYFLILGQLNLLDSGFTFFLTATVFAFILAQNCVIGSASERRWMIAAWAGAALAVLSKGIVVAVLAGGTLILYSILERDPRPWRRLHVLIGLPVFLIIAAPWFVVITLRNPEFPGFFFVHEHFARFLTTVHQHEGAWWFFLPYLLLAVVPWVRFFPASMRGAWRNPGVTGQFRPQKFLLALGIVTLGFFSVSGSKLAPYILPMIPAVAALVGIHVAQHAKFVRQAGLISAGILLVVAAGVVGYAYKHNGGAPSALIVFVTGAVAAALATFFLLKNRETIVRTNGVFYLCMAVVFGWSCLVGAYTATPPLRTMSQLAEAARPQITPRTTLYSVGQFRHSISFYLQRPLVIVGYTGELEFGLQQEPGRQSASAEEFATRWRASSDSVAFIGKDAYEGFRRQGLPGRVVAADKNTVVVSRSPVAGAPATVPAT